MQPHYNEKFKPCSIMDRIKMIVLVELVFKLPHLTDFTPRHLLLSTSFGRPPRLSLSQCHYLESVRHVYRRGGGGQGGGQRGGEHSSVLVVNIVSSQHPGSLDSLLLLSQSCKSTQTCD